MRIEFTDKAELESIRADIEAQGLYITREHLNADKSGFIEHMDAEDSARAFKRMYREELLHSDAGLARGLEDLINVLEDDGMTIRTKLPQELQDKLARRVALRDSLSR